MSEGVPLLCRLGLHEWPSTYMRGAQGARCMRCGKQKRVWPWQRPPR